MCKILNDSVRVWIGLLLTFIFYSCHSYDNDQLPLPQLTDAACNDAPTAIFLNDQRLADASVKFISSTESKSDSVRMVLSGVHPTDIIELDVVTRRSDGGFIQFEGERIFHNIRHIKVEGFYRPYETSS